MAEALGDILQRKPKIGLFGIGRSNIGIVEFLRGRGYDFSLTLRSDGRIPRYPTMEAERVFEGSRSCACINEDILFLSPSVRRDRPELLDAAARGVRLSSDAEIFFELSRLQTYAVSGSDGKSTTSYLISSMLRQDGTNAIPCGNFGISLASLIDKDVVAVAELSSFQLMYCLPRSRRAVLTSVTPNHLNWHKSFEEYIEAKSNITKLTEGLVFDFDSEWARHIASEREPFCAVSASLDFSDLRGRVRAANYMTRDGSAILLNGEPYFTLDGARRLERYNVKNYMLASAALIGECSEHAVVTAVNSFRGLSHRAETVCQRGGVTYINSSIDSTPERTLETLRSLSGRVAVIIGGMGKGLSLDSLADELPRLTVCACLMGDVGDALSLILKERHPCFRTVSACSMEDAVSKATLMLGGEGTVILSPAATSFDRYENFEKRGEDFKRIVSELRV